MAVRVVKSEIRVPLTKKYYAVTAMSRYGLESEAIQMDRPSGASPRESAVSKGVIVSNGKAVSLPGKGQILDADFIVVETMQGNVVAIEPYTKQLQVTHIPDGYYQLRSLGKKGRNHR